MSVKIVDSVDDAFEENDMKESGKDALELAKGCGIIKHEPVYHNRARAYCTACHDRQSSANKLSDAVAGKEPLTGDLARLVTSLGGAIDTAGLFCKAQVMQALEKSAKKWIYDSDERRFYTGLLEQCETCDGKKAYVAEGLKGDK